MLQGFKQFIFRGNVLDLAVAVVMGAAFGAVVTAPVKDLITPLIATIIGKPYFSAIEFTVNGSRFPIGDFINAIVSFILIGAAVYFFIVLPVNKILARMRRAEAAPSRPLKNAPNASAMCQSRHVLRLLYLAVHRSCQTLRTATRLNGEAGGRPPPHLYRAVR
jgi:large conductance mechanosensitive channel